MDALPTLKTNKALRRVLERTRATLTEAQKAAEDPIRIRTSLEDQLRISREQYTALEMNYQAAGSAAQHERAYWQKFEFDTTNIIKYVH